MSIVLVGVLIFVAAVLYSSVGQAGASGYLAVMALCGVTAAVMKPTALTLNVLVATIVTARFARAGCFSWSLLWPFAIASVPMSFIGGAVSLPANIYNPIVGAIMLFAAYLLHRTAPAATSVEMPARSMPLPSALASGAGIGLLSGLTGSGGGIFLTPLLLFRNWAGAKESAGVSAAFILVNSLAGLAGNVSGLKALPDAVPYWAVAAAIGGLVGAELGSRRLSDLTLRRLLMVVLVVAGVKLLVV